MNLLSEFEEYQYSVHKNSFAICIGFDYIAEINRCNINYEIRNNQKDHSQITCKISPFKATIHSNLFITPDQYSEIGKINLINKIEKNYYMNEFGVECAKEKIYNSYIAKLYEIFYNIDTKNNKELLESVGKPSMGEFLSNISFMIKVKSIYHITKSSSNLFGSFTLYDIFDSPVAVIPVSELKIVDSNFVSSVDLLQHAKSWSNLTAKDYENKRYLDLIKAPVIMQEKRII